MNLRYRISLRLILVALIAAATWTMLYAWSVIQKFVRQGLADSGAIRVSEKTSCSVSQNSSDPHFTGCNSIL